MQEKEFLQGYEIKNWEFGPRIYKIIAASTVLTLLPIFALAQTNMLSASACDSPFVGTVCEVLDTVYAGAKILAKDTGYFEGDYQDIQLKEENELIWRDETYIEPKLVYPEGYFEIANRDELAAIRALENPDSGFANVPPGMPPINPIAPPTPKYNAPRAANRGGKKPVFPKKKSKVLDGEIGDDPIGDLMAGNTGEKSGDSKTPDKTPVASKTPDASRKPKNPLENQTAVKSDAVNDNPINRQPLYDVADETLKRVEAKQVDLGQGFIVRMNGVVTPEGMLDEEKSGWGKAEGDEPMIELAKIAITKVGVSGWLKYLSDKDANRLNIMFGQNDEQMIADVRSDLQTENKAKSTASALRGMIQAAILADKNGWKDMKDDEIALLKASSVTNEGRVLVIKFNLDKRVGQQIIAARLAEYKQKKAEEARKKPTAGKPSGSLDKASRDSNAGR
ncbi:MAG: hypothetical protein OEM82_07640 [Acidobacteriota bacterium]|nr:hypothetical protein [Acidobacteriota bacterium]MDH3527989.1 hypothetical protein [Acidobacteriota bacterium]